MRWWTLLVLLPAGCSKLFGLEHVDPPGAGADARADAVTDGLPARTCFTASFDDGTINPALLNVATPPQGGSTMPNALGVQITWPAGKTGDNYGYVETQTGYDITGGDVSVDVDDIAGDMAEATLYVTLDTTHTYIISVNPTTVEFDLYDGSSTSYTVIGSKMPYSSKPLHLRIADDDIEGTVIFEVATPTATMAAPTPLAFTGMGVTAGFAGGSYGPAAAQGHAQLDNFALTSRTCL